jgi:Transposase, Mutator family
VRQPRLRDRGTEGERIKFTPSILPPYARRSKSLEVLLPILYLKGLSTGDFGEALTALLGKDAPGLSASTIARLKAAWPTSIKVGKSATSRPNAMFMFGPTAFICRLVWKMTRNASLSCLARHRKEPRN